MSFIVLGCVLLVALVHLFVVLFFSEADFLINFFDDLVHVLAFTDLTKDVALEFEHGLLDDPVVEVDHVGGDLSLELGVLVHYWLQVLLPKTVRINVMQGLVEVLTLVAKQVLITADDGFLAQLDVEVPLLLVAEADAVLA